MKNIKNKNTIIIIASVVVGLILIFILINSLTKDNVKIRKDETANIVLEDYKTTYFNIKKPCKVTTLMSKMPKVFSF